MSSKGKRKKSGTPAVNVTGIAAIRKCRTFVYLIFLFELITMFYQPLASVLPISETRILYGMVLMIGAQTIVASMHIVQYATTIEQFVPKKEQKQATMYTARTRFFILMQFAVLLVLVLNHTQIHQPWLAFFTLVLGFAFVIVTLQNMTIVQKKYL